MRQRRSILTASDLEEENRALRRRIVELGELVLDAGERSLRGRVAPFEGQSVVLHERTWARVIAGAVHAIEETSAGRVDGLGQDGLEAEIAVRGRGSGRRRPLGDPAAARGEAADGLDAGDLDG